jgi:N-methylhydantoinase B/oxoprolinase/acetone carboxylase alpha subunit
VALFDPAGELVMQAEHIPVHLGSMPDAVLAVRDERHSEGDLWILNDPFAGGTHLPDITLISPVFAATGAGARPELIGFAASRAHHADVGGPTPGGMPADSHRLEDEGVVIPPTRADDPLLAELADRMRNPEQRLADLRAQRAANLLGARRLAALAEKVGSGPLREGTDAVLDYSERRDHEVRDAAGRPRWPGSGTAPGAPRTAWSRPRVSSCCGSRRGSRASS